MLAGQLLSIADDIIDDYKRLKVIPTLQQAVNALIQRPNLNDAQFAQQAHPISEQAEVMLNKTVIRAYPIELKRTLSHSSFSQCMPDAVAKTLLAAFRSKNKKLVMSSSEMQMYLEGAQDFLQKMKHLVEAAQSFGVETYQTPEGQVAIEVLIPDRSYGRSLGQLPQKIRNINAALQVVEELATGSRSDHKVLWISTTNVVIAFLIEWGPAALGIMYFYERLLIVAEKHLSLIKLYRELRQVSDGDEALTKQYIDNVVETAINEAVADIVKKIGDPKVIERQNELKNELKIAAKPLVPDLAAGLRLSLDPRIESKISEETYGQDKVDQVTARLEDRTKIEARIDGVLNSAAGDEVALIAAETKNHNTGK
ncbi:hypothetical protein J7481_19445 [Labrenzia sp. R4_2]|uniref:hypothetical protein n=1 Tax=Labrenzia sp. R4_2 TaxID=2821107 RepID=UPI001ADBC6E5|nr:hypothetical protein [Labrenzia sp. R4_2]MBO9421691.1 hypothetical protein [Labrenzia sp. R4_2]